jgi:exonuclease III
MYHLKYSAPDIPQSQYGKAAHIPNKCTCSACSNMILLSELPFYKCRPVSPVYSTPNDQVDLNQSGHSDKHLEIYKSNSKHLSVMHLNTQCMTSTFGALSILINDYHFDIVTLSETWLKDNPLLLQHVSMPGYQLCYNNRDKCRGGGVGAYIKESIKFKRGQDIENLQQEFEHLWLEISGKNKNNKLLLGVIYRSEKIMGCNDWIEKFDDLLSNVVPTWDGMLMITGDVNINLLEDLDPVVRKYNNILKSFNLTQHISQPTRTTSTSRTLNDHLITNDPTGTAERYFMWGS